MSGHGPAQTAFNVGLTSGDTGHQSRTNRVLSGTTSWTGTVTQARLTLKAIGTNIGAANVALGKSAGSGDTTATPVEVKFSGASGCTVTAGTSLTSDWAEVPGLLTSGNVLVGIVDNSGGGAGGASYVSAGGGSYYKLATASYSVQTVSSSSYSSTAAIYQVDSFEVRT